jgi:anaerobic magnesium-protoporphyrin IX monomethyl ester cyclase
MKCALIIPAWSPSDIFSSKTASSQINYWQPVGTLSVAAALQREGHEVRFFNGAFMTHQEILQNVEKIGPQFIGIYSTTFGWEKTKKTASDLKSMFGQDVFICAGGPYPIAVQERCLEDAGKCLDAVVTGEGEITTPEMIRKLTAGGEFDGVLGIAYRKGERIIKNPPRPLITDLDSLPFPSRELLGDANRYIPPPGTYRQKPVAVMITSRGCNRRCIYCFQMDKDRRTGIRYRSIGNVLQEIEHCLNLGYNEIKFLDDTFAADYNRAMDLAQEIRKRGLKFTWFASACVNQVDKPLLRAFKNAGCWAILFGAESGVQKNLNMLRKGTTLEQIRRAVREAQEVGLRVSTPFMFGIPGETFEEGLQTIQFSIELNPDMANFHAITPFPGTVLYDDLKHYGTISNDLEDFTYQGAAFVPFTMTRQQILQLRQLALKRFYSRPAFILRKLLQMRNWNDCVVAAKSARSLFWLWRRNNLFLKKNPEGES